ncbi:hypothetical protein Efla_003867 [Eimeria flavescens]
MTTIFHRYFFRAEPVGSRSHQLPVEVIQEPYELVEWSTDVSGGRRALPFPPGLLVGAAVALVAFLFIWKSDRKRLLERLNGRAREVPTAVKPEPEHGLGTSHPKAALGPSTLLELQELLTKLETTQMDVAQRRTALGDVNIPPEYLDKHLFMHLWEKVEGAAEETYDIAVELQASLSDSGLLYVQGKANALQQKIEKRQEEELLGNLEGRAELLYNEGISSGGVETEEGARGALDAAFKQCGNFLLSLAGLRDIVFDGGPRLITAAHQARKVSGTAEIAAASLTGQMVQAESLVPTERLSRAFVIQWPAAVLEAVVIRRFNLPLSPLVCILPDAVSLHAPQISSKYPRSVRPKASVESGTNRGAE